MAKKATEDFAARLRRFRLEAGLSVSALAERVGLSRSYVCDLESGRRPNPSLGLLQKLAAALGVSLGAFDGCKPAS